MKDEARWKEYLLRTGRIQRSEIARAEDYALTAKIPLEEALVFLDLIDFHELGVALSELYGLPYRSLLDKAPPKKAKRLVSEELAEKWHIFPVDFNEQEGILTLALSDPENLEKTMILEGNLFAPHQVMYTVASDVEILRAIQVFYKGGGKAKRHGDELEIPEDFRILPEEIEEGSSESEKEKPVGNSYRRVLMLEPELNRARAIRTLLELEGIKGITWVSSVKDVLSYITKGTFDALLVNGNIFKQGGAWLEEIKAANGPIEIFYYFNFSPFLLQQAFPYEQMSDAMISMAAFFASWVLKNEPKRVAELRLCARYTRLLALRVGLQGAKVDALVLASWLSVPELRRSFFESVKVPYPLERIMDYMASLDRGDSTPETLVFAVVRTYLEVVSERPEIRTNLDAVRAIVTQRLRLPSYDSILEAFLNLLREDHFLQDVGKPPGKILIVDPDVMEDSGIFFRLSNEGYQVERVASINMAIECLSEKEFDVVISETHFPDGDGLAFCRDLKAQPRFQDLLFMFLTSDEEPGLPAKSLEAGADDFFMKPVDLELLTLKISRVLSRKGMGSTHRGVSGSLRDMSLTDVVQILAAGDKEVVIHLEAGEEEGEIYIKQGEIIHAVAGDLSGEKAFYHLMRWNDANFHVTPCREFPERTIDFPLMSLLMEGARLMDEIASGEASES